MKIEETNTDRGFNLIKFNDLYHTKCNIQKSSLATEDAIWLGVEDPSPQKLVVDEVYGNSFWMLVDLPEGVHIKTRMHLNQEQAKALITILQKFVDTGEIV
jgi:hypothetical protein